MKKTKKNFFAKQFRTKTLRHRLLFKGLLLLYIEPALRFNGTCPQKDEPFMIVKGKSLFITYEDCIICKEHCIKKERVPLVDWPKLDYPGKDPKCVGFCPVDCEWGKTSQPEDCKKEQEDYFKDLK